MPLTLPTMPGIDVRPGIELHLQLLHAIDIDLDLLSAIHL
jgi:hypothetical protein